MNLLLLADSSKGIETDYYPQNTEKTFFCLEAALPASNFIDVTFFGLQYYLQEYLQGKVITEEKISEAEETYTHLYGKFKKDHWQYILKEHDGHLPVKISALPEGTITPRGVILLTVENTDNKCAWLPSFLEGILLKCWYPTTIATAIREMKMTLLTELENSGTPDSIDIKLQDFSYNDNSSPESAALASAAHLLSFKTTFNPSGVNFIKKYYEELPQAYSYPILKDDCCNLWKTSQEAYSNFLIRNTKGIAGIDVDNMRDALNVCGRNLKLQINSRNGGFTVATGEFSGCVEGMNSLQRDFGSAKNEKQRSFMQHEVKTLYRNNFNHDGLNKLFRAIRRGGWSIDNINFALTNMIHKELSTCNFKYYCTNATIGGIERDIHKYQKQGKLKVVFDTDLRTVPAHSSGDNILVDVFENGKVLTKWKFEEIQERAFVE